MRITSTALFFSISIEENPKTTMKKLHLIVLIIPLLSTLLCPTVSLGADVEVKKGQENTIGPCTDKIDRKQQIVIVENLISKDPKDLSVKVTISGAKLKDIGWQTILENEPTVFSFKGLDSQAEDINIEIQKIGEYKLSSPAKLSIPKQSRKNQKMTVDFHLEEKSHLIEIEISTGCDVNNVKNVIVKFISVEPKSSENS